MKVETIEELRIKKCTACEGGVAPISDQQAAQQVAQLDGWRISDEGAAIVKKWTAKNFMSAIDFFNRVAQVAEAFGGPAVCAHDGWSLEIGES